MKSWLPGWAWRLIWKHLWSRKSRPAVRWMNRFALLGLIVGVLAWTSVVSIMDGLQGDIKNRILNEKPHLLWEGRPSREIAQQEAAIRAAAGEQLQDLEMILQSEALLEVQNGEQRGRINGSGVVVQGLKGLESENQIGFELMEILGLAPGDQIRLHSVWRLDLIPLELEVNEGFASGVYEVDRSTLRVPRSLLERWLGLEGAVSRVELRLKDPTQAPQVAARLAEQGFTFKTWHETEASLWYSLKLEKIVLSLAVFFVVLIAALAVHLALSVRVAEKTREIGLLRGLGADDKILSRLYLTEGALLGVLGSSIGLILGYGFCRFISEFGQLPQIYYSTQIPVDWNWGVTGLLAFGAVVLSVLASWLPARKVRFIEVQEALRS